MRKNLFFIFFFLISACCFGQDFSFLSRFQLDASSKIAEGRVRVDVTNEWKNGSYAVPFELRGFATFYPASFLGIGAGNSFFKKYPVKSAWLSASDDYLKTGRLLKSGVGLISRFDAGENVKLSFSASGSPEDWNESGDSGSDSDYSAPKVDLNFGFDVGLFDFVSLGATAENVLSSEFQSGVFTGFNPKEGTCAGLLFNAGYVYNFRDSYMGKTRHALMLSGGYENKEGGWALYGDYIQALTKEYLKKSGKVKNYSNDILPFYSALCFRVDLTESLKSEYRIRLSMDPEKSASGYEAGIFTGFEYKLPKKYGTLEASLECETQTDSFKNGTPVIDTEISVGWKMKIVESKK